ncbi:hypothetical protein SBA2_90004 [Acidobacteriia bacterium SbA2]|nr:hypothetical protein SBA2_90004 [Acidobacteriia bacterium SbA2]
MGKPGVNVEYWMMPQYLFGSQGKDSGA